MKREHAVKTDYILLYVLLWCSSVSTNKMANDTLYNYYTLPAIKSGLNDSSQSFLLNNKEIIIYSGAVHYFRVPQDYWRDRLRRLRAAGLNTVETYVPWNLHEPEDGYYDFGKGGSDFENFLSLENYLKIAQEEDLFVIVRPGPYICSEFDFGGMPSWLLRNNVQIRTSDEKFMEYVRRYFKRLFEILVPMQFTKGGSIIAFQVENEYGNVKKPDENIDVNYLEQLKEIFSENGVVELLFTSDTPSNGNYGSIPGVLYTANFQTEANKELDLLQSYQPNKPLMVMEYWTGWFDHWTEKHHTRTTADFGKVLEDILRYPASVNFYMFHGGTNWGFLNGANIVDEIGYLPDTSSYDYDAPLTENGNYTDKYYELKKFIGKYDKIKTFTPEMPAIIETVVYPSIKVSLQLTLSEMLQQSSSIHNETLLPMEFLSINNNSGQSYGYIVYRKSHLNISKSSELKIEGNVCDTVMVTINGQLKSNLITKADDFNKFGYWRLKDSTLNLGPENYDDATLDLIVENWGRNNFGKLDQFDQKKGLWQGNVLINDAIINGWEIYPLEFKKKWTEKLQDWHAVKQTVGPSIYKAVLNVIEPKDTFIKMQNWRKGIIIVNGFVLSRYFNLGPQQTVYLPAPLLKKGDNDFLIFEHFSGSDTIEFSKNAIYS